KDLTDRAKEKLPTAEHISVENFLSSPKYGELVERLQSAGGAEGTDAEQSSAGAAEADKEEPSQETTEKPANEVNKVIFACDAGMGSSAMGASLMKSKF